MINHELLSAEGILILTPVAPLEATDFEKLAQEIDPYIEANGKLHGLMIVAESFPGWKDFPSLIAHLRFIKNHHRKIQRVAIVSDNSFLTYAPRFASHFVQATIRHFPHSQREEAHRWLKEGDLESSSNAASRVTRQLSTSTTLPLHKVDELCINTLRFLAVDMVQQAKSGHPGLPLGSASMAYALWDRSLKVNPHDPLWPDRDRFVLSAGHGCALLYALLHVTGFDLPLAELQRFRQWGSRTPGHPEFGKTPGVEATTGPLGQGLANSVGMAIAEGALAARFNRSGHQIVDHYTYVLASDGDLEEGISSEPASLRERRLLF